MNIITKGVKGKEYIIRDIMATSLTAKEFEKTKDANQDKLGDYKFVPFNETDFSWWSKITKKLTKRKIVEAYFEIDFYGKVREI